MWAVLKKEFRQFFSNLTGYLSIIIFLLLNGLFLFVFTKTNILDFGYASLDYFFELAPWILLLLIPAVTMRVFADEYRNGTIELLCTKPLTNAQITLGKFFASLFVVVIAILPTISYIFSIYSLKEENTMLDWGGIAGSYIGLLFLCSGFTSIGIWASSFTSNAVVAFLLSAFACFSLYFGFTALSSLPVFANGADYYIQMIGMDFHYRSMSRGVIDSRDIIYFASIIFIFLWWAKNEVRKK